VYTASLLLLQQQQQRLPMIAAAAGWRAAQMVGSGLPAISPAILHDEGLSLHRTI
jgi:hypothetical protein